MVGYSWASWWTSGPDRLSDLSWVFLSTLSSSPHSVGLGKPPFLSFSPPPALSGVVTALCGGAELQRLLLKWVLCLCWAGLDGAPLLLINTSVCSSDLLWVGMGNCFQKKGMSIGMSSGKGPDDKYNESNTGVKTSQIPFILWELERRKVKESLWGCFILLLLKPWRKPLYMPGRRNNSVKFDSARSGRQLLCYQVSCKKIWCLGSLVRALEGNEAPGRLFAKSQGKGSETVMGWKSSQALRECSNKWFKGKFQRKSKARGGLQLSGEDGGECL